jgi:hypothetical protein
MPLSISHRQHPIRWFVEPTRNGGPSRYRGRDVHEAMVHVPEHQRDYVWKLGSQQKLINSVMTGFPIPSLMVTQDEMNRYSLEDGQQRLETLFRFRNDQFSYDGRNYSDFTDAEKKTFLDYNLVIIDTTGATQDEQQEIYDRLNQGVALSDGEKFFNRRSKKLVKLAEELIMTRGSGLHALAMDVLGDYLAGHDKRHTKLANAVAYIAGAAYGPQFISTSYNKLASILDNLTTPDGSVSINQAVVRRRLEAVLNIYKDADEIQTCANATKKKAQWKVGLYSAYILYSVIYTEEDAEMFDEVKKAWVNFLVEVRRRPSVVTLLYKGMAKSNNITLERLEKGYSNLLEMSVSGFNVEGSEEPEEPEEEEE